MKTLKLMAAAVAAASLSLAVPALAHDHETGRSNHDNPASSAGGTPHDRGVGGSVSVPGAGGGPEETSPYREENQEDAADRSDGRSTAEGITSGDRPITNPARDDDVR